MVWLTMSRSNPCPLRNTAIGCPEPTHTGFWLPLVAMVPILGTNASLVFGMLSKVRVDFLPGLVSRGFGFPEVPREVLLPGINLGLCLLKVPFSQFHRGG